MPRLFTLKQPLAQLLWLGLLLAGTPAHSQSQPQEGPQLPAALVMPWAVWGINEDNIAEIDALLMLNHQSISRAFINNPMTLSAYMEAARRPLIINARKISDRIQVGPQKAPLPGAPASLTVQPILCPIADRYIVGIEIIDTVKNIIVAAAHESILKKEWRRAPRETVLNEKVTRLGEELLRLANSRVTIKEPKDALHIGLSLTRETTRHDQGSSLCLNMLLAHQLSTNYTVGREIGNNEGYHVRDLFALTPPMLRATRRLVIEWDAADYQSFPLKIKQTIRTDESVFGGKIMPELQTSFVLSADRGMTMPIARPLADFIDNETAALVHQDKPKIAAMDRAWAYLDRGRAWGLKMNDRLYLRKNGEIIKGHIVGYYGPGLGIASPRGFKVHEGAILFIRKGQKMARVGDELDFDPTVYPTTWPPKPTP